MENPKSYNGLISLLMIIILTALCILFATGIISFNSNKTDDNTVNNNEINTLSTNDILRKIVGTYKKTTHSDCGVEETTLTIHNNGTADIYMNACVGGIESKNAIFSINEHQIYLIDKTCEMVSSNNGGTCTIDGGCYSGGCQPLWTFDYKIDGSNITIEDLIKQ